MPLPASLDLTGWRYDRKGLCPPAAPGHLRFMLWGGGFCWGGCGWGFTGICLCWGLYWLHLCRLAQEATPGLHIVSSAATFLFLGVLLAGLAANLPLPPEEVSDSGQGLRGRLFAGRRMAGSRPGSPRFQCWWMKQSIRFPVRTGHIFRPKAPKCPLMGQTASFHGTLYHPAPAGEPLGWVLISGPICCRRKSYWGQRRPGSDAFTCRPTAMKAPGSD